MLHFYDKSRSVSLLAFAAMGGLAFTGAAQADESCANMHSVEAGLVGYVTAATACVQSSQVLAHDAEQALSEHINAIRMDLQLSQLDRRTSLDMAAQAHAIDMIERGYVAHLDPEGRSHLYRVRAFDRTGLIGDFGAVVMQTSADLNAAEVTAELSRDAQNAANLIENSFTDIGVGIAVADGRQLVVLAFADVEGDLEQSMPLAPESGQSLAVEFEQYEMQPVTWRYEQADTGELIRRSFLAELNPERLPLESDTALIIEAQAGGEAVSLKGPLVTRN